MQETPDRATRSVGMGRMLIEAGLALASELSLDAVLHRIVDLAAEITDARYGALAVLSPDGHIARFVTTGISEEQRRAIAHPPEGRGILGLLFHERRIIRIADIAADPRSAGFPENHPVMHSFLGAAIVARGRSFGNLYLTDKQTATEFTEDDERAVEVLAAQAGVAVENARLYEEATRRERWLEGLHEIAAQALAGADRRTILQIVARLARELSAADLASVAVPSDGGELVVEAAVGEHAERLRGTAFPLGSSVAGEVIRFGRAAILEDAAADHRADEPIVRLGDMGPAIVVPLASRGRAVGTLEVANLRGGRRFQQEELRTLEAFAAQAAIALEYQRAQRELQRLAVLEERERIARELHDGVVQSLFAVGMGLQGAAALSGDREIARRLEDAVGDLDRVIGDLRNYIFGLRPGILADLHLDQALREMAAEFQSTSGVLTVVEVDAEVAGVLASRASDVIQFVREALSNVGRHADAATCRLTLRRDETRALLEIDDDGRGFDVEAGRLGGQGIGNLRRRAIDLGGEALIESSTETGTTVRILLPL